MKHKTIWTIGGITLAFILTAGLVFGHSGFGLSRTDDMPWNGFFHNGGHYERMHRSSGIHDSMHRGVRGMHGGGAGDRGMHGIRGVGDRGMHGGAMLGTEIAFDSEAGYLTMMIPHHEEAIERSRELLELTSNAEMVELLESIIAEQTAEIELMEGRLADRYPDFTPSEEYEPMMRSYEGLTPEEAELVFIEDMIPHHMHAIMSSHTLLRSYENASEDTRELASSIIASQRDEIHLMHDLYAGLTPDSARQTTGFGRRRR